MKIFLKIYTLNNYIATLWTILVKNKLCNKINKKKIKSVLLNLKKTQIFIPKNWMRSTTFLLKII